MSLRKYNQKRDFKKTPEPEGKPMAESNGKPIFVVQKHNAKSLHYDLRIEADGVLKSWAMPKGPSMDPEKKRLAIRVEDHPLSYAEFEGVIPEGEYGAGSVIVWDRGIYETARDEKTAADIAKTMGAGHLRIKFHGDKMKGGYSLIRTERREGDKPDNWLLIKTKDEYASKTDDPTVMRPQSVISGKTNDEIGERRRS